jgi:hypothetical protein
MTAAGRRSNPLSREDAQQALWLELMALYIREARLLDERKLKGWPRSLHRRFPLPHATAISRAAP